MGKLSVMGLAVSLGVTWAFFVLCIGWCAAFGWGTGVVETMSTLYIGYAPTWLGGLIGALWGFFDGAVAGIIIALIYNLFVKKV